MSGSFKRMYRNAKAVQGETGINVVFILLDMLYCIFAYNVGYLDYRIFGFAGKSRADRKSYLTYNMNNELAENFSKNESYPLLKNKLAFNEVFKDYLGRDFFNPEKQTKAEFKKFLKGKDMIFIKPADSFGGLGIYKRIKVSEINPDEFYDYLIENKLFAEDCIKQHPTMDKLSPYSINTLRIATLLGKDGKAHFVYAILRIGIGTMSVDNSTSGGLNTCVDDQGIIPVAAFCDKTSKYYTHHPDSNFELTGFKVPMYKEAVELAVKAANFKPDLGYVGWDIAISEKGPLIVEGNNLPGYDMPQNHGTSFKNTGMRYLFEEILGYKL